MLCGRAERKGQLKRDGNIMWHCPFKFDFDYYALINNEGSTVKTAFKIEDLLNHPEFDNCSLEEHQYKGCPAHNSCWHYLNPKVDWFHDTDFLLNL